MEKLFILQLLIGTCRPTQEISADLRSVSPGEIITLHCSISTDYEISWFHQNSEQQMKLLISAERGKINKSFSYSFNINKDHYEISENSSSVSLVIKGVNDTDLGLYYCGGRNYSSFLQFGKPIRLTFTDKNIQSNDSSNTHRSPDPPDLHYIINIFVSSMCSVSVLINIICLSVFCYRARGKCCRAAGAGDSTNKVEDLQYASLQHSVMPRGAAGGTPASTSDSVIYSGIKSRSGRHSQP
ncbi:hypothetical protein AMEX_G4275 [Astyanax mexicanus]|uniref:Ig-like domain-containing protein n=1 Tax=Astyanax mexicanus TaxID=7994 RepID=A0A8T2ME30_ASTMX|nr:hypothetical protein AMEX_G4275 [Astyanax mexicanus]